MIALELTSVGRRFSGLLAVDAVSFAVEQGAIHAVIGPNGAGKTTLFNLISGIDTPTAGTIQLFGHDVTAQAAHRRTRAGLARTFQNIRAFGSMTVLENVLVGLHGRLSAGPRAILGRLPSFRAEERRAVDEAMAALRLVGLADKAGTAAAALAYGDQRRLEIARAVAAKPRLVLLDEPAAGMNPAETESLAGLVHAIRDQGATVLLVEHDMGFVMDHADRVSVLNFGRLIFEGTPREVHGSPEVIEAYLGAKVAARLRRGPAHV